MDLGHRELVNHHWADGVEEDLKRAKEGFAEDGVKEEGFERRRKVGIEAIDAEGFVVRQVVRLWPSQFLLTQSVHPCYRTRKAALYGNPIGKLAKIANSRLANGALKARL